jgi:hypothetical protein
MLGKSSTALFVPKSPVYLPVIFGILNCIFRYNMGMVVRHNDSMIGVTFQYIFLVAAIVGAGHFASSGVSVDRFTNAAYENLASIATLSVGVPVTPENTLALQFAQRDGELTAREAQLLERERSLGVKYDEAIAHNKRLTLSVLGSVTFLLLLLILLNFYLDLKRNEEDRGESRPADHHGEFTTRL